MRESDKTRYESHTSKSRLKTWKYCFQARTISSRSLVRWGIISSWRSLRRRRRRFLNSRHSTRFRDLRVETREHEQGKYNKIRRDHTWSSATIKFNRYWLNVDWSNLSGLSPCELAASLLGCVRVFETSPGNCCFHPFSSAKV